MDNKQPQNPSELTPDEQLDMLLAKFLAEEDPKPDIDAQDSAQVAPEVVTELEEVPAPTEFVDEQEEIPAPAEFADEQEEVSAPMELVDEQEVFLAPMEFMGEADGSDSMEIPTEMPPIEELLENPPESFLAEEDPAQNTEVQEPAQEAPALPDELEEILALLDIPDETDQTATPQAPAEMPSIEIPDEIQEMTVEEVTQQTDAESEDGLTMSLDDMDLEAILRAAFSDIDTDGQTQEEPQLTDDTILLTDVSQAAQDAAETPEEDVDSAAGQVEAADLEEAEAETEGEVETETAEAEEIVPPKKRRPKNPHAYGFFGIPHMAVTAIWLAIIVFIGASLGRMIWQVAADMLAFDRENQAVTITITADDDLDSIAQKLQDTGLIRYKGIFKFYGKLAKAEQKIQPGTYYLNTIFDYNALVKKMSSYTNRATTEVVIPEGYTCAQIFQLLEQKGVCSAAKLEAAAMNADLSKYWFLEGIDRSAPNCLEGYLFPDTYQFYLDSTPELALAKLLNTFNTRFSEAMVEKLAELNLTLADMMRSHGLPESYIEEHQITIRELVIIASLIEKETSGNAESYYISSVIYNRLTNPGEYPYLNIDAALVYAVGHSPLTSEDLKFDSPYNTYLYQGLVPGPIANPGVASLNAALSPESTEFYFYALNPNTGSHEFFKTYKAHQAFLESLRNGG